MVGAGLLLLTLARVICWLFSLSLLATVHGLLAFALGGLGGVLPAAVGVDAGLLLLT